MNPLEVELERRRQGGQRRQMIKEECEEIDGRAHSKVSYSARSMMVGPFSLPCFE